MASYLTKRKGWWHYARRVPSEFAAVDRRGVIREKTKIRVVDDPRGIKAGQIADQINRETEAYWRGLLDGKEAEARERYEAARKRARAMGFDYAPAADLAQRTVAELLQRIETLVAQNGVDRELDFAAGLGGEQPPALLLSELFKRFEQLQRASIKDMSEDQIRKWRNPRKRAINNLITVVTDKPINQLTRVDALDFRTWWQDRVLEEGLQINTANKDIGHLNDMLQTISEAEQLKLESVFGGLRLAGGEDNSRASFEALFVQKTILKSGALGELNSEARSIIYIMAETGMRPSEICNLNDKTIRLDVPVPHVEVLPDGRRMKTKQSKREIPLVGVALLAAKAHPDGFPRYRDNADAFSALANKFLGGHGMRPTEDHTVYSLRHTFEDRLTAIEAPDKLIAILMGHKFQRPRYGAGPTLEQKQKWLQRIAFTPPSIV